MKFVSVVFVALMALASFDADAARRLGGGGSVGRQSSNVTQREAAQPAVQPGAAPTATQKSPAAQQAPATAAQAAAPRRPWGGMLAGLAAGLGLAWLAHALGFGEGFAQFMLVALLALVVIGVVGFIMRSRRPAGASRGLYAYQGAGGAVSGFPPSQYDPSKVGNDASARPWERGSMAFDAGKYAEAAQGGVRIGSALAGSQSWGVPAGFDTPGFLSAAKRNFVTLQDAWDRSDLATLRSMMTDEMLGEIQQQLAERERSHRGQPNKTEVIMLEAQLLGIEDVSEGYMASVEFSGVIREEPSAGPNPFREVWNMTKPKDGSSGWLVAGVQALQ